MERIKSDGMFQIDERIATLLGLKEGDFVEQQIVKDEYVVLKKVEGDRLQVKFQEKITSLTEALNLLKKLEGDSEMLAFLIESEERTNRFLDRKNDEESGDDFMDGSYAPYNEERDMSILDAINNGTQTLSEIANSLKLASSSVSESLNNLHNQGLIDVRKENDGKRGRPKNIYSLSFFGQQQFL